MDRSRAVRAGALVYVAGLLIHTADHFRRGTDVVSSQILVAGTVSTIAGLATVGLIVAGHRLGVRAAALLGLPTAIGVSAVHLLPHWSATWSDAFPGGAVRGVTALSWAAVSIEIAGAALMGAAALSMLLRPASAQREA